MRRLPCLLWARGFRRHRPSMRRLPCPSPAEHAQTLVLPRAASGLGVEMVFAEILCAETPRTPAFL